MANSFLEYYRFNTEIALDHGPYENKEEEWGLFLRICPEVA